MSLSVTEDRSWLGEVPSSWEVKRLKYVADFVNGAAFKPSEWEDEGIPIIRIQNLNGGEEFNYSKLAMPARYHISKGDLLFGWSGNRGTSFGPFRWLRDGHYYLNQHIFKVYGHDSHPAWLYWVLKAVTHEVEERAHGIIGMVHVTRGELDAVRVPVPPRAQQRAIADFLDRKTAAIDALIEKKERLIALLQEKRQALITQAVTKGLDSNVPMKDSSIEWLGEIPTHWNVKRLKHIARVQSGIAKGRKIDGETIRLPYLRVANVQDGHVDLTDVGEIELVPRILTPFRVSEDVRKRPGELVHDEVNELVPLIAKRRLLPTSASSSHVKPPQVDGVAA